VHNELLPLLQESPAAFPSFCSLVGGGGGGEKGGPSPDTRARTPSLAAHAPLLPMRLAARTHTACHGAPSAPMAAGRRSSRPRRRKRADDGDGGERRPAAAAASRGGAGGNEQQQPPPAAAPRPLISGPAPFQLPRWPLRPLDEDDDAAAAGPTSSPAAASLAQQRLRAAFESARADAVTLGVPSSALPRPQEGASAEELAAALAHAQDVMASFLSANI